MGKFKNQTKNIRKRGVATSQSKRKQMKREVKTKNATQMEEGTDAAAETPVVRGLSVANQKALAAGEFDLKKLPKVNEKKLFRKFQLPVREGHKVLDAPSGKKGTTAQYITKKKAKKMYKRMTQDARETFKKMQAEGVDIAVEEGDEEMED
ncbi:unnamed protein product [Caenorhabditis angaria]|uniref:Uncharacterized protein n=1 Tax=Caenorhabditis angaria TaxID=860376 RepID=A0A9P1I2Z8_9PELO|nr:unnamed protein product [Caenorhabditis angaria]